MSVARVIAVAAQKGGAGKTTVTMCLAGTLARRGYRIAVVDMDPQQTAMRWCGAASDEHPFQATVMAWHTLGVGLARELPKIERDYDFVLVDCPPSVESNIPKVVLGVADIVLVPTRPSGPDLWATSAMADLIADVRLLRGGEEGELPALIVPNQVQDRTTLVKLILKELKQAAIPASRASLAIRTAYQQAALAGMALEDFGPSAAEAVREISALADEVLELLGVDVSAQHARTA